MQVAPDTAVIVIDPDAAASAAILPLPTSMPTTPAIRLTCFINPREWVACHISVRIEAAAEADGVGLDVSAYRRVVIPEVVVVFR
jgi:hypothetical protein